MINIHTSISATMQNNILEQTLLNAGLDSLNENAIVLPLKLQNITKTIQIMKEIDLKSLSIIDRLQDAHSLIDRADSSSKEIKETNFIVNEKGSLTGYNTYATVLRNIVLKEKNKPIAIFGDGPLFRTALFSISTFLPDIFMDDAFKSKGVAKALNIEISPIDSFVGKYPIVINCNPKLKIPAEYLNAETFIDFLPLKQESPALKILPKEKTISAEDIFIKQITEKIFLLTNKYPSELYLKAKLRTLL